MRYEIRPHHGLCSLFFAGKGLQRRLCEAYGGRFDTAGAKTRLSGWRKVRTSCAAVARITGRACVRIRTRCPITTGGYWRSAGFVPARSFPGWILAQGCGQGLCPQAGGTLCAAIANGAACATRWRQGAGLCRRTLKTGNRLEDPRLSETTWGLIYYTQNCAEAQGLCFSIKARMAGILF